MPYEFTKKGLETQEEVRRFMEHTIYPNEEIFEKQLEEVGPDGYPPILDKS
jgi:acyl-CoA dehydrogenase